MTSSTLSDCLTTIKQLQLLSPAQLDELMRKQRRKIADTTRLGQELLKRGWLSPYQVDLLLQGRGSDLVFEPYIILEPIGEGRTGEIFKARNRKMDRIVALKMFRRELVADYDVLARFYREIQVVSQVNHANIVHAYDAGPIGGRHMIVMEYVAGVDLARLVAAWPAAGA